MKLHHTLLAGKNGYAMRKEQETSVHQLQNCLSDTRFVMFCCLVDLLADSLGFWQIKIRSDLDRSHLLCCIFDH